MTNNQLADVAFDAEGQWEQLIVVYRRALELWKRQQYDELAETLADLLRRLEVHYRLLQYVKELDKFGLVVTLKFESTGVAAQLKFQEFSKRLVGVATNVNDGNYSRVMFNYGRGVKNLRSLHDDISRMAGVHVESSGRA